MSQILNITVPETKLAKLRALASEGKTPLVPWSGSKAEMDDRAFKRRGEILEEIERELGAVIEGELLPKEPGQ
jgi:hypothetical protein